MTNPDKSPDPNNPSRDSSRDPKGQQVDWLQKLITETNFTKETIERLPTYEGRLPELPEIEDEKFSRLKSDAGEFLLELLTDPDEDLRNVAAHALSVADKPELLKQIMLLAQDKSAQFDHRMAAFDALAQSKNAEVQIFLAKFITTVVSAKSFLESNKNTPKLDPNQIHIKTLQHQELLKAAAKGLSAIANRQVLEIFETFASEGKYQALGETLKGITTMEREMHLEAVMIAARLPINQPTELVSKLLRAGLTSKNHDLQDAAIIVANRNPALLTEDDFELLIATFESWIINHPEPNLVELGKTLTFGEVLSHAKDPEVRAQIRQMLTSAYDAHRVVALLALKGSSDPQDHEVLAGAVERSQSVLERSIAISGLGDWIKKPPLEGKDFAIDILMKNLLIFEMVEDCKVSIIEALKGTGNKSFAAYCLKMMQGENFSLAQAAAFALEEDRSPEVTEALIKLIQENDEDGRFAQGFAADTLAKRRDILIENELFEILSSAEQSVAIRVVNALKGTDHGPALNLLLEIGMDPKRHPELRSDAIYAIKVALERNSGLAGTAFQRKVTRALGEIIADQMEEPDVRQSAINSIPEVATTKIVKNLIEMAKSPDISLPDAAISKLNKMSYPVVFDAMKSIYEENPVIERKLLAIDKLATQKNASTLEIFLKEARSGHIDLRTKFIESMGLLLKD